MKNFVYAALLLAALYFLRGTKFLKFKKMNNQTPPPQPPQPTFTEAEAEEAIKAVKDVYGAAIAKLVEKIWRYETAHFKSEQYTKTGTAGMVKGNWPNLPPLKTVTGIGTVNAAGEKSKNTVYYLWTPKQFAFYLADFLKRHNLNAGRWNSTEPTAQKKYSNNLLYVKTKFV